MKYALVTLVLLFTFSGAHAEMKAEDKAKLQEESSKFQDQNAKMREDFTLTIRDLRIEHLKQLYDLKIKQQREVEALRKMMIVGDKESNEKIKSQIKTKQEAFKTEEKIFNFDFDNKTLKSKQVEFDALMEKRREDFKNGHKK